MSFTRNSDVVVRAVGVLKPLTGDDGVQAERVRNVAADLVLHAAVPALTANASAVAVIVNLVFVS